MTWQKCLSIATDFLVMWNQIVFLRSRSIQHSILLCSEVLHYARVNNIPTVFLKINFRKAFDSLNWDFIQLLFLHLDFGSGFSMQNPSSNHTRISFSSPGQWPKRYHIFPHKGSQTRLSLVTSYSFLQCRHSQVVSLSNNMLVD